MPESRRSILITGCSSGIGHDAAHTLARRGWRVLAACRKPDDAERLKTEGLETLVLDYEDPASVAAAADDALDRTGGRIDALFNNGAYLIPGPVEDLSRDAMAAIFNANFLGWHDLTRRLIPAMRARGHGRIVNCSSILGLVVTPYRGAYCATKFAVEAWSDALRIEMKGTGIHVSLIEPGPIVTDFRKNAILQFERWVDWQASPRADDYRATLLDRLYKGSANTPFQLPPSAVTARLIRAIERPRPKARYYVTLPTHAAALMRRVLPSGLLDRILIHG
jgi:NAD(P)-dependent dehydrogenase (short-subunit alcohol dehydrogenase family)